MEHILSLSSIRARKAELNRTIGEAQAQLADLDVAERIVLRFGEASGDTRPSLDTMDDLLVRAKVEMPTPKSKTHGALADRPLKINDLFQSVLRQSAEIWMTANEIQERASAIKGQEVPMGTVSPMLSIMKSKGVIVRDGLKVALAERLNDNGEALASPSADEAPTSSDKSDGDDLIG